MFGVIEFLLALRNLRLLVSYVASNSFPQPLSEEEEAYYIQRLEEHGDDNARRKLIEHNLRLVAHIVKKYDNTGEDLDDLISIGTIGLIKGVKTYNSSKGTKLATYAARCIENEILMHLRSTKRSRNEAYLEEPIGVDKEGNEITLLDTLPSEEEAIYQQVERVLQQAKLQELMELLSRRERLVLELRYGLIDGVRATQREIARELKISRSYVSRIEKRAIQKLMKALEQEKEAFVQKQEGDAN